MTKARNLSSLLDATGDVVSTALDNVPPSDNASSLTTGTLPVARLADGSITNAKLGNDAKVVKSASAPSTPSEGDLWYDQTNEVLKIYQSTVGNFVKVSAEVAVLSSVTGNIVASQTSNLTLNGSGFLNSNLVVNFLQASDAIDVDVTVTPTNDTSATVTVPSSVYNNVTTGNVVTIKVTNSDGKSSGNQTITALAPPYNADFLVIAGGGGGGHRGGGSGAGGYRNSYSTELSGGNSSSETNLEILSGTVYTITVGAGGAGSTTVSVKGSNGNNSSISGSNITTITSIGGGGGASDSVNTGNTGGSGGGGANNGSGASGTSGQGTSGASATADANGGGGGAGQSAPSVPSSSQAGNGGNGLASSITGSSVTRAGGGGGGHGFDYSSGSGGSGGGGNGSNTTTGGNGTANTGSGAGGGGRLNGVETSGGNGGSGIVILRMPTANYSGTTTGSPSVSQSGSDTILTYTGDGSYTG